MLKNNAKMKLGKKPVRKDPRTLKLERYIPGLPTAPPMVNNTRGIRQWDMMLNGPNPDPRFSDGLGDCTIAAVAHADQSWILSKTKPPVASKLLHVPDSVILSYYENWCGYSPADPTTDQGGVALDVLNNWRQGGFNGHKILAYASINYSSIEMVKLAIWLFGGIYIGLEMPVSAQRQDVWKLGKGPDAMAGSWGGHAIFVNDYSPAGPVIRLAGITWGQVIEMTWEFWQAYVSEGYAILSADWNAPDGFDKKQLLNDLNSVTS